jgi:hypothetical protein
MSNKFHIESPCHENWQDMSPSDKGRFCDSCAKEVVDFTAKSQQEIAAHLQQATGGTCGRFMPHQIKVGKLAQATTPIPITRKPAIRRIRLVASSALAFLGLSLLWSKTTVAQNYGDDGRISPGEKEAIRVWNSTAKTIRGTVRDSITKTPIALATITIESGGQMIADGFTDENGFYELTISPGKMQGDSISVTGYGSFYASKKLQSLAITKDTTTLNFELWLGAASVVTTSSEYGGYYGGGSYPVVAGGTGPCVYLWDAPEWEGSLLTETTLCATLGYVVQVQDIMGNIVEPLEFMGDISVGPPPRQLIPDAIDPITVSVQHLPTITGRLTERVDVDNEPLVQPDLVVPDAPDLITAALEGENPIEKPLEISTPTGDARHDDSSFETIAVEALDLEVFPNPSADNFTVHLSASKKYFAELCAANGTRVVAEVFDGDNHNIDVSTYERGTYMVRITALDDSYAETRQVIVQ